MRTAISIATAGPSSAVQDDAVLVDAAGSCMQDHTLVLSLAHDQRPTTARCPEAPLHPPASSLSPPLRPAQWS
eukprot:9693914-Alexandrium_andersonii.AAC.1